MKKATRITSALLVISMMLSLSACGETQSNKIENTTAEKIDPVVNTAVEPTESINTGAWIATEATEEPSTEPITESTTAEPKTETPTTEVNTEASTDGPTAEGQYEYLIFGTIPLKMDINVDEWIITNSSGWKVFMLRKLATSLGWEEIEGEKLPSAGSSRFVYKTGDIQVVLGWYADYYGRPTFGKDEDDKYDHLSHLKMYFYKSGSLSDHYYSYPAGIDDGKIREVECAFEARFDKADYVVAPSDPIVCLTYDEIVIWSYMLWQTTKHPGENPFYYSGCYYDMLENAAGDNEIDIFRISYR